MNKKWYYNGIFFIFFSCSSMDSKNMFSKDTQQTQEIKDDYLIIDNTNTGITPVEFKTLYLKKNTKLAIETKNGIKEGIYQDIISKYKKHSSKDNGSYVILKKGTNFTNVLLRDIVYITATYDSLKYGKRQLENTKSYFTFQKKYNNNIFDKSKKKLKSIKSKNAEECIKSKKLEISNLSNRNKNIKEIFTDLCWYKFCESQENFLNNADELQSERYELLKEFITYGNGNDKFKECCKFLNIKEIPSSNNVFTLAFKFRGLFSYFFDDKAGYFNEKMVQGFGSTNPDLNEENIQLHEFINEDTFIISLEFKDSFFTDENKRHKFQLKVCQKLGINNDEINRILKAGDIFKVVLAKGDYSEDDIIEKLNKKSGYLNKKDYNINSITEFWCPNIHTQFKKKSFPKEKTLPITTFINIILNNEGCNTKAISKLEYFGGSATKPIKLLLNKNFHLFVVAMNKTTNKFFPVVGIKDFDVEKYNNNDNKEISKISSRNLKIKNAKKYFSEEKDDNTQDEYNEIFSTLCIHGYDEYFGSNGLKDLAFKDCIVFKDIKKYKTILKVLNNYIKYGPGIENFIKCSQFLNIELPIPTAVQIYTIAYKFDGNYKKEFEEEDNYFKGKLTEGFCSTNKNVINSNIKIYDYESQNRFIIGLSFEDTEQDEIPNNSDDNESNSKDVSNSYAESIFHVILAKGNYSPDTIMQKLNSKDYFDSSRFEITKFWCPKIRKELIKHLSHGSSKITTFLSFILDHKGCKVKAMSMKYLLSLSKRKNIEIILDSNFHLILVAKNKKNGKFFNLFNLKFRNATEFAPQNSQNKKICDNTDEKEDIFNAEEINDENKLKNYRRIHNTSNIYNEIITPYCLYGFDKSYKENKILTILEFKPLLYFLKDHTNPNEIKKILSENVMREGKGPEAYKECHKFLTGKEKTTGYEKIYTVAFKFKGNYEKPFKKMNMTFKNSNGDKKVEAFGSYDKYKNKKNIKIVEFEHEDKFIIKLLFKGHSEMNISEKNELKLEFLEKLTQNNNIFKTRTPEQNSGVFSRANKLVEEEQKKRASLAARDIFEVILAKKDKPYSLKQIMNKINGESEIIINNKQYDTNNISLFKCPMLKEELKFLKCSKDLLLSTTLQLKLDHIGVDCKVEAVIIDKCLPITSPIKLELSKTFDFVLVGKNLDNKNYIPIVHIRYNEL